MTDINVERPTIHPQLDPNTFASWYWLKVELQTYCRVQGLPASGSKAELMQRIRVHLGGVAAPTGVSHKKLRAALPSALGLNTVIKSGWPLNQTLRDFFVAHLGMPFRFNQALRDLFKNPQDQTLADALALYARTHAQTRPISGQFQFNQHMRDYFAQHPGATREQALQAWRDKRQCAGALNFFNQRHEC